MKYCKNCQIKYETPIKKCLLCQNELDVDNKEELHNHYVDYTKHTDSKSIFFKSFVLANLISIVVTMFIDYNSDKVINWSLIVGTSNLFLIFMLTVLMSKIRFGAKIVWLIILTTIETISIGFLLNDYHWAIDIILPFSLIATTLFTTIVIITRRKKWQDYISLLLLSVLANLLVILLNIFKVTEIRWVVSSSFIYGLLTLFSLIIFSPKTMKEEFLRRFHY